MMRADAKDPLAGSSEPKRSPQRQEFITGVRQEIRAPMSGILGTIDLLRNSGLTPEQRDMIATLEDHASTLVHLVNDLIDLTGLETGDLELEQIDFDLRGALEPIVTSLSMEAEGKGLSLRWAVDPDVPALLRGDPGRLKQAVFDLAKHAIQFSRTGEIFIQVVLDEGRPSGSRTGEDDRGDGEGESLGLDIRVSGGEAFADLGKLRPVLPRLGSPSGALRPAGPLSLGLSVVQRIAGTMQGGLFLGSGPGLEDALHLVVRLSRGAGLRQPAAVFPGVLRGLKALLVDTNTTNLEMLKGFLQSWGVIVDQAGSTAAALNKLSLAAQSGEGFRLVLLDDGMSGSTGFDLAQQIKQRPEMSQTTVVLLTSAGMRGDAARCRQVGVAAYLTKPIRPSRLLEALAMALGAQEAPASDLITRHSLNDARRSESGAAPQRRAGARGAEGVQPAGAIDEADPPASEMPGAA